MGTNEPLDKVRVLVLSRKRRALFFILKGILIAGIIGVGVFLDSLDSRPRDLILLPTFFFLLLVALVLASRLRTLVTPNQYLSNQKASFTIQSGDKVAISYPWEAVTHLSLGYEGVKIYLIMATTDEQEVVCELCDNWLLLEFVKSKSVARKNYQNLMSVFSNNSAFMERLEVATNATLREEFNL